MAGRPRLRVSLLPADLHFALPGPVSTSVLPPGTCVALLGRPLSILLCAPAVEPEGPGLTACDLSPCVVSLLQWAGLALLTLPALLGRTAAPLPSGRSSCRAAAALDLPPSGPAFRLGGGPTSGPEGVPGCRCAVTRWSGENRSGGRDRRVLAPLDLPCASGSLLCKAAVIVSCSHAAPRTAASALSCSIRLSISAMLFQELSTTTVTPPWAGLPYKAFLATSPSVTSYHTP